MFRAASVTTSNHSMHVDVFVFRLQSGSITELLPPASESCVCVCEWWRNYATQKHRYWRLQCHLQSTVIFLWTRVVCSIKWKHKNSILLLLLCSEWTERFHCNCWHICKWEGEKQTQLDKRGQSVIVAVEFAVANILFVCHLFDSRLIGNWIRSNQLKPLVFYENNLSHGSEW